MSVNQYCGTCLYNRTVGPFDYKKRKATARCQKCNEFFLHKCPFCNLQVMGQNFFNHLRRTCAHTKEMTAFVLAKKQVGLSFVDTPTPYDMEKVAIMAQGVPLDKFVHPVGSFKPRSRNKVEAKKPTLDLILDSVNIKKRILEESSEDCSLPPRKKPKLAGSSENDTISEDQNFEELAFEENAFEFQSEHNVSQNEKNKIKKFLSNPKLKNNPLYASEWYAFTLNLLITTNPSAFSAYLHGVMGVVYQMIQPMVHAQSNDEWLDAQHDGNTNTQDESNLSIPNESNLQ